MTNYFSNIYAINEFLKDELKDVIILPVLTSNIALNSGNNDYSNFAVSIADGPELQKKKK